MILEKAKKYIQGIGKKDKICIIHDTDPDGICAAIIIQKCIKKLLNKKAEITMPFDKETYSITQKTINMLKKKGINKIIFLDFSIDQHLKTLKKLEKWAQILIIDHHKIYHKINNKKITMIKPQMFTKIPPSKYCTAKLAYDICSQITDMKESDWLAATASIADVATEPWKKWIKKIFKKHKIKWKKNLFETKLGQTATIINNTYTYNPKTLKKIIKTVYNAKKPDDIIKSELKEYHNKIQKEIEKNIKEFKQKAEKHKDLRFFLIKTKHRIGSTISTILGLKYKNKTIIIARKENGTISISARRNDQKKAVNEILEKAVKGLKNAHAGGHKPAAGARIRKQDLKIFKERILKLTQ
ncbi:hypothetical protein B6U93_00715 [Candidatus Woesearchaeota archaeon ex4484_78]|nr:MAG: hypothetical protein B6U93_00715 [Candidatus Woesearchaeota archaeon ex4484_78]